jgi:hypothetical protein
VIGRALSCVGHSSCTTAICSDLLLALPCTMLSMEWKGDIECSSMAVADMLIVCVMETREDVPMVAVKQAILAETINQEQYRPTSILAASRGGDCVLLNHELFFRQHWRPKLSFGGGGCQTARQEATNKKCPARPRSTHCPRPLAPFTLFAL